MKNCSWLFLLLCAIPFYTARLHGQCRFDPLGPNDKNQLSYGIAYTLATASTPTGITYVVYNDGSRNDGATVMQFNGFNWTVTGNREFSASQVDHCDIA
ncbi:MAG: hypothetical protein JNM68_11530, partial [Dinghuibacter sp.]|nr:hypothetical protein [Dinghuibacter sp.]